MIMPTEKQKKDVIAAVLNHNQGLFGLIERDQYFKGTAPYPNRKKDFPIFKTCPECKEAHKDPETEIAFNKAMRAYRDDQAAMFQLFKFAALTDCGIADHPKADRAFSMAWDRGHSSGYYEVLQNLEDLSQLLKD